MRLLDTAPAPAIVERDANVAYALTYALLAGLSPVTHTT
jgi:hypothetical protein